MTNPTSNFGWQMPTPTDLVTDLPADFEVFGQAVDTSMADLKGGTTGQILSKATNADMDFTWITNDVGDITAVNVTAPITGGGTSGAVTIGVDAATTSAAGVVQLSDSTSTTSSVLASTPTATKSAYDLASTASTTANAAIPKSTVTTAGDVIYATGSSAVTRLGIGSTGQVLTVAAGAPSWATPASPTSGLNLIARSTIAGSAASLIFDNCFTSTYTSYLLVIENMTCATAVADLYVQWRYAGPTTQTTGYAGGGYSVTTGGTGATNTGNKLGSVGTTATSAPGRFNFWINGVGNASQSPSIVGNSFDTSAGKAYYMGVMNTTARVYTGFLVSTSGGTNLTGEVSIYGLAK